MWLLVQKTIQKSTWVVSGEPLVTTLGTVVMLSCIYPLAIDRSPTYTVEGASVINIFHETGSFATGFATVLNNGNAVDFVLGNYMPFAITMITWSLIGLSTLSNH